MSRFPSPPVMSLTSDLARLSGLALCLSLMAGAALALCQDYGPQTPRDISNTYGRNGVRFDFAPPAAEMNLCNIHTHTNAEHMGPGFSVYAGPGESGGFRCTGSNRLSVAELTRPGEEMPAAHGDDQAGTDHAGHDADQDAGHVTRTSGGHGVELPRSSGFQGVQPGDTIEVHWVYSTCPVDPGPGLGACLSEGCANPQLRVESQVFLVVNDPNALDFMNFVYRGTMRSGLHQPRSLPTGTGNPVVFRGSTTGPSYSEDTCSPL